MSNALVVAHQGNSTMYIRSDYVAARMMQQHLDPKSSSKLKVVDAREAGKPGADAGVVKRSEGPKPPGLEPSRGTGIGEDRRMEALQNFRNRVAEMSRALLSLQKAADMFSDHKLLIAEGDSATAVAYAGQVLGEIHSAREARIAEGAGVPTNAEDAEIVEVVPASDGSSDMAEMGGQAGVTITATGERVDSIEGTAQGDTITVEATVDARNIIASGGDDTVFVSGDEVVNVSGGAGNDTVIVNAFHTTKIGGGAGHDVIDATAVWIEQLSDGDGNDTVTVTARDVGRIDVGRGDDVFDLQVGRANLALRAGMGNDVVNLKDHAHLEVTLKDHENMLGKAVEAVWEGSDLAISFENGDSLRINNAANAGSLSLRAGDRVIPLTAPSIEPAVRLLDINV